MLRRYWRVCLCWRFRLRKVVIIKIVEAVIRATAFFKVVKIVAKVVTAVFVVVISALFIIDIRRRHSRYSSFFALLSFPSFCLGFLYLI